MSASPEVLKALTTARRVLVTSHVPPDGDGLGAGLALVRWFRSRGAEAVFAAGGPVQACLRFLYKEGEVDLTAEGPEGEFDLAVALDAASRGRLGDVAARYFRVPVRLNLDHHASNEGFGTVNWVDPEASSVGEIVYRALRELGAPLTPEIAEPLYVAVLTDTGRFCYSNTTPAVHEMAAKLLATGVRPEAAAGELYRSIPLSYLRLVGLAAESITVHAGGRVAALTATEGMIRRSGADPLDVGDLVDLPISLAGVEVGVLFRPAREGGTKVSLRSRSWFSVSNFARRYGGGGHPRAAGATLPLAVEEAREEVLDALLRAVEEGS